MTMLPLDGSVGLGVARADVAAGLAAGGDGGGCSGWELRGVRAHLVGIGGCGMSALARLMRARGALVTGSDPSENVFVSGLCADGFVVDADQSAGSLPEDVRVVVASAAIKPDNEQVLEAERRGVVCLSYAEALGRCMEGYTGVAIAGTHGKSTTTAMLGCVLRDAGLDPSVIVGAVCGQLDDSAAAGGAVVGGGGGGYRIGAQRVPAGDCAGVPGLLLAEACEFNRSFHNYRPRVAAITSVEADHLDVYGSLDAIVEAFRQFASLLPGADEVVDADGRAVVGGTLLIAHEGAHRREITAGLPCRVLTIGFSPEADYMVRYEPTTREVGLVRRGEGLLGAWVCGLPGAHNAMNSATAAALSHILGADMDTVSRSLGAFKGLKRRSEFLGERVDLAGGSAAVGGVAGGVGGGVRVWDDYGHHPTEIEATLRALREFERPQERGVEGRRGRLICVFQPHQHSRTRFLLDEFASAFASADVVIVPHIYFVRDSMAEKQKVSASDLVDRLRERGVQAMHLYPFEAIVEQLENVCRPGDVLVVMGAGPVDWIAREYLRAGDRCIGGKGVSGSAGCG